MFLFVLLISFSFYECNCIGWANANIIAIKLMNGYRDKITMHAFRVIPIYSHNDIDTIYLIWIIMGMNSYITVCDMEK